MKEQGILSGNDYERLSIRNNNTFNINKSLKIGNNVGLSKGELKISEACADAGPILKRFRPRAQGRGYKIQKPTCHIRVSLSQMS